MKIILSVCLFSSMAMASIPSSQRRLGVEDVLVKKNKNTLAELKKMGPEIYSDLSKLAFNEDRTLAIRWKAFMAMVRLGEKESLPEIKKALSSRDWFMRDAAIRVLPLIDQDEAFKAAMKGLDDSALVVRTSAVDTLKVLKRPESAARLWQELHSKDNYIRNQSLWIRRHIVEALAVIAPPGNESQFVKVLDDTDSTLFAPAIKGLERLTGKKLGEESVPAVYKRYTWKKWFAQNK